nr:translation initiation factor IF-2-like [Macaca fascicularis]
MLGGPAGGRPAGSSPRRPARIKPRARPRARAPAEAAAPGPPSRGAPGSPGPSETPNPGAGRDQGAAAPPTHPGAGARPRERPPGMKRFPVPSSGNLPTRARTCPSKRISVIPLQKRRENTRRTPGAES